MESPLDNTDTLLDVVYHVFLPPKLPQQAPSKSYERQVNYRLVNLVLDTVEEYQKFATGNSEQWTCVSRMLTAMVRNVEAPLERLRDNMASMRTDDVLALHIRAQNAAVLVCKSSIATTFEIFEVQPPTTSVMSVPGKLVRHFPELAIQVSSSTAGDPDFIEAVANFLSRMNVDVFEDAVAKTTKAGSTVDEERDSTDPHYISQLFAGILRSFGEEVEPRPVVKRTSDEVLWDDAYLPWRRSPIWLIIRVALQTSLDSVQDYKHFMVYFHACLLGLAAAKPSFSSNLLHTMRVKMARRLVKIQASVSPFVVEAAKQACDRTQMILQGRWDTIQAEAPKLDPLDLDMDAAVVQSLPNSRDYICKVLEGRSELDKLPPFCCEPLHGNTHQPPFAL